MYGKLRPECVIVLVCWSFLAHAANTEEGSRAQPNPIQAAEEEQPVGSGISEAAMDQMIRQAFQESAREAMPMSPELISKIRVSLDAASRAIHPAPPPKMISRSQSVTLQPGATPPVLRMAPGYVSSLVIVDSTGAPWPITTATVGNDRWFSIVRPETGDKNLITVNALANYANSNVALTLEGRDTPLIVQLFMEDDSSDKKATDADMLLSLRVDQTGPHAKPPSIGEVVGSPMTEDLISFLDGVPPVGAVPIAFREKPDGVSAWNYQNTLYLRTIHPARWPAWRQVARGSGDVQVYVMPMTDAVILSVAGNSHTIKVAD